MRVARQLPEQVIACSRDRDDGARRELVAAHVAVEYFRIDGYFRVRWFHQRHAGIEQVPADVVHARRGAALESATTPTRVFGSKPTKER